jgi:hypothetical protein
VHLASIDSAGRAHVGDNSQETAILEQAEGVDSGLAADYGISAAFESSLNVGHHGGLILDEQHGQKLRFEGG